MKTARFENDKQVATVHLPDDLIGPWTFHLIGEREDGKTAPVVITANGVDVSVPGEEFPRVRLDFLTAPEGFLGSPLQTSVESFVRMIADDRNQQ